MIATVEPGCKQSEMDIKTLVVDDKWLATLDAAIHGEMDRISQTITLRRDGRKTYSSRSAVRFSKLPSASSDLLCAT